MGEEIRENYEFFQDLLWDDAEGYKVVETIDEGGGRWHRHMTTIFLRESDNKLFITNWQKGATENQDHEYTEIAYEAEAYTETVTKYRVLPRAKNTYDNMPKMPKCSMENFDDD